jgi:WD40 repeat protein
VDTVFEYQTPRERLARIREYDLAGDAEHFATVSRGGELEVWEFPQAGTELPAAPEVCLKDDGVFRIAHLFYGADLVAGGTERNEVAVFRRYVSGDRVRWEPEGRFQLRGVPWEFASSRDGRRLAAVHKDRDGLVLWDAPRRRAAEIEAGPTRADGLAFSPQGDLLACGIGGIVRVFRLGEPGAELDVRLWCEYRAHPGTMWALDFHPNGRQLATGGYDGQVRLWDLFHGPEGGHALLRATIGDLEGQVRVVRFSTDGRALLAAVGVEPSPTASGQLLLFRTATDAQIEARRQGRSRR